MKIEQIQNQPKKIVVFAGRFQPMHKGHNAVYNLLTKEFGDNNVYIATSNLTDDKTRPFNFKEKQYIAHELFGIPISKIIETPQPYEPKEILHKFNPENDIFILVVGEKDKNRFEHKWGYFQEYAGEDSKDSFNRTGYLKFVKIQEDNISASKIRAYFKVENNDTKKKKMFKHLYGKFNQTIFNMFKRKFSDK